MKLKCNSYTRKIKGKQMTEKKKEKRREEGEFLQTDILGNSKD